MITTILQLIKSRAVWFAILLAALSVVQGYVGLLRLQYSAEFRAVRDIALTIKDH